MVAPVYTTDLTDITTAESTTGWSALGGGASGLSVEPDFTIQGSNCIAKQIKAETKGHVFNNTATTQGSLDHIFTWIYVSTPGTTDSQLLGGLRVTIGSGTTDRKEFYVAGNDTYAKGGWINYPVRYDLIGDNIIGTPGATPSHFGAVMKGTVTVKAPNLGIDAIRQGYNMAASDGDASDPVTLVGIGVHSDATARAYGSVQVIPGGVTVQCTVLIGNGGSVAYTAESNIQVIFPDNNPVGFEQATNTGFKEIRIDNSSSTLIWEGISFTSLDSIDRGIINVITATTSNITGCTFQNLEEIVLHSSTNFTDCAARNCKNVFGNTANITECNFDSAYFNITLGHTDGAKLLTAEIPLAVDVTFNDDGLKMFVLSLGGTPGLYEYDLTTAYDTFNTVTYSGNSYAFTSEDTGVIAMTFNDDGTKMFALGNTNDVVYEYTLSTAYDLSSTITYTTNSFSIATEDTSPRGIAFNADGTVMFVGGQSTDAIYEYTLSTGFDLSSTVAVTSNSLSTVSQVTAIGGIEFGNNGFRLYCVDQTSGDIKQYRVITAYSFTDGVLFDGTVLSVSSQDTAPKGIAINDDTSSMVMVGANNTAYGYFTRSPSLTVSTLNDIDSCSFVSTGKGHAVEVTAITDDPMSWNSTDTSYASVNGSTGNETIFVTATSGTLTINVVAGATTPTIRTRGATITVQPAPVTMLVIVTDPSGSLITDLSVNVLVEADTGGPLAAGTDIIKGFTDVNGEIEDTSSYTSNQPITGWVRKSSASPFYRQANIIGTISSANGLTLNIQLVDDE